MMWLDVLMGLQAVAVIIGTIYAGVQYAGAKKARQQEKAAAIMLRYGDTIHKISLVESAFGVDEDILNIINKISQKTPLSFALYERREYGISEDDATKYMTFIEDRNPFDLKGTIGGKTVEYKEILPVRIREGLSSSCSIGQLSIMTLNEIEHLCMEIESGAVDDEYLYGALHQTLLPFIHKLAILLQSLNKSSLPEENYYSYTRKLYGRWVIREAKNYKKMKKRLKGKVKK